MKWIDYREKLGIGFSDSDKAEKLNNKIDTFLTDICSSFERNPNISLKMKNIIKQYFIIIGELPQWGYNTTGLVASITEKCYITETISKYVAFLSAFSSFEDDEKTNEYFESFLIDSLDNLNIKFTILEDEDGKFFFPVGAKELDDALVSQPFEWLENYPRTRKTYTNALKQYTEGIYIRDVADNFRKALEEFFQEFLKNPKNLSNNTSEIFKYLKINNAEPELAGMVKTLLNSYDTLNNKIAKHNDKVDEKYLEFLMYQTGVFIRMLIVVKQNEKET